MSDNGYMIEDVDMKVFVSYSWDSKEHRERVKNFVSRLRTDGLSIVYDEDLELGDRITQFMENSIATCQTVLFICTPQYKLKADSRIGGVGYENTIITGELYETQNERKFIPILFYGTWKDSIPIWAKTKLGVDLTETPTFEENYQYFVQRLKKTVM